MATKLAHCQCPSDPGGECTRLATAEDMLCDSCREVKGNPKLLCCTTYMNGKRIDGNVHLQTTDINTGFAFGWFQ